MRAWLLLLALVLSACERPVPDGPWYQCDENGVNCILQHPKERVTREELDTLIRKIGADMDKVRKYKGRHGAK